jgi:hypothetical protein
VTKKINGCNRDQSNVNLGGCFCQVNALIPEDYFYIKAEWAPPLSLGGDDLLLLLLAWLLER